jgi:hypothetical protein
VAFLGADLQLNIGRDTNHRNFVKAIDVHMVDEASIVPAAAAQVISNGLRYLCEPDVLAGRFLCPDPSELLHYETLYTYTVNLGL